MRDDDTLDDQQLAPASTGRSDEIPSSEQGDQSAPGHNGQPQPGRADRNLSLVRTRLGEAGNRIAGALRAVPKLFGEGEKARVAIATGAICCLGLASFAQTSTEVTGQTSQPDVFAAYSERAEAERAAGRSMDRSLAETLVPESAAPAQESDDPDLAPSEPAAEAEPAPEPEPAPQPVDPGPVAGLTVDQMNNAKAIVRTGRDMGVERRGLIIAVATAMQESNLYNLASGVVPESMNHTNQGVGWDHDSVGLFQQRASSGWGPVHKLMDPAYSTQQFLGALQRIPGWQQMRLTAAAQAVQISAYPDHYAKHEARATQVVDAIVPGWN